MGVCNAKFARNAHFTGFLRGFKSIDIRAALMTVLHIILRNLAFILFEFFGQEVGTKALLEKRVALIAFIPKYIGVDTMCAVGANRCIVGAPIGAWVRCRCTCQQKLDTGNHKNDMSANKTVHN